ncbi:hypothetical protein [Actinoplanes solisilvae]|uniref:hypothetical protein n=1 Tax=Actinoplanes solisilvae TaxID=2486853 RepID=UPI000FD96609|nr:hypothetical protein [Actinoplanes solisilvae]
MDYRVGDVLRISCPFAPAVVTGIDDYHVFVRWPWWQIDPDAEFIRWNGDCAVARDDAGELFTTEPPAARVKAGDTCQVGVLPRIVHVIDVDVCDPPRETGWLPRTSLNLVVLPAGEAPDPRNEFQGTSIEPSGGVPFRIERVFRPYAFLEPGDDVADNDGRAWQFTGPWSWVAYDGAEGVPVWPLTLLAGASVPEAVAEATAVGEHETEVRRWRAEAGIGVARGDGPG